MVLDICRFLKYLYFRNSHLHFTVAAVFRQCYTIVPMTDIVTFLLSFYFLARGASRGLMNSLIGPFSIIVTTVLSIIYFQSTKDIIASLALGLIGPLFLGFFLKFLLKTWARATNREIKSGFLSRLAGAILNFAWGWIFIIFTLMLLAVLPPWGKALTAIHDDVRNSGTYIYIADPLGKVMFAAPQQNAATATIKDPNQDIKLLAQDPRFQKILQDPDIRKEIDAHDIGKLMSDPKMIDFVQQIMNDPATMKKIFAGSQATKTPSAPPQTH